MTVKQAEFMERYLNGGLQNETDKKKNNFRAYHSFSDS